MIQRKFFLCNSICGASNENKLYEKDDPEIIIKKYLIKIILKF